MKKHLLGFLETMNQPATYWIIGAIILIVVIVYLVANRHLLFLNRLNVGDAITYNGCEGEILEFYKGTTDKGPMVLIKTKVPLMQLSKAKK